ncbi:zinc finger protein 600-like [Diabrotica virgifera virgifera]|uniref:C2H2-type domain-containing protein n=1 Tax=Diabrotica virgifera virgifera TaxID=50390 RepID=A0ABM5L324_DIAVI|nr:zinc finger protein 600-like [Diabrotica virgifera virgifera]
MQHGKGFKGKTTTFKTKPGGLAEGDKAKPKKRRGRVKSKVKEEIKEELSEENVLKFSCELCDEKISSSIFFAMHSAKHSLDKKFHCHYCNHKSSKVKGIVKHMKFHGNIGKEFQCEICMATFPECIQAIEHKNFHSGELPYRCEVCEKHFMFSWLLFTHRRLFHPNIIDPASLVCDICNISFGTRSGLRKHHFRKHNKCPMVPPLCEICGKSLANNETLKFHRRTHTGEKPHTCTTCGKSFRKKGLLVEHERTHTGEKPFICPFCQKGFSQRAPLKIHQRIHTGERPYIRVLPSCEALLNTRADHTHELTALVPRASRFYCCEIVYGVTPELTVRARLLIVRFSPEERLYRQEMSGTRDDPSKKVVEKKGCTFTRGDRYERKAHPSTGVGQEKNSQSQIVQILSICKGEERGYFDTSILNKLFYGPGITITPIKKEPSEELTITDDGFAYENPKMNLHNGLINSYSDTNGANDWLDHSQTLPKTEPEPEEHFSNASEMMTDNILSCLQKKSKKKSKSVEKPKLPIIELDEPIHCEVCDVTYKNNVAFALHSDKHSEDGKFTCHLCDYKNASKYHVEMHIRAHEGTTKYKCEVCDKAFTVSTHAIEHKYYHTGEKPFECDICGKHFMFSWFLTSHRRTQHWELVTGSPLVKYDCTLCNKHYTSSTGLKRHNLSKHNASGVDASVLCDICGKRLSSKEKLKFHRRTHTGYKPYSCDVCTKSFSRKEQLKEHERVHTGYLASGSKDHYINWFSFNQVALSHWVLYTLREWDFEDEVAENIYIVVSNNQKHPVSRKQPPFCNVCEKDFGCSIKYAKHSLKHSLDGIFRCFICHVNAKMTLDQIETHIRIHQNIPKYTCSFCDARLYSKYSAIKHESCHSGIRDSSTVFCDLCSKGFMFLCSLQAHHKEAHPEISMKVYRKEPKKTSIPTSISPKDHLPIPIYPNETITCFICKERFEDNIKYALHTVRHSEKGYFNCYLCALQCKMSHQEIIDHIKMHLNSTIRQCPVCRRGFTRKTDAEDHINYHNNKKPFECKDCSNKFMFNRCLLSHRRNHHNLSSKWLRGCTACDVQML